MEAEASELRQMAVISTRRGQGKNTSVVDLIVVDEHVSDVPERAVSKAVRQVAQCVAGHLVVAHP